MGIRKLTALNYIPVALKIVRFYNFTTAIALPPLPTNNDRAPLSFLNTDRASLPFPQTTIKLPSPSPNSEALRLSLETYALFGLAKKLLELLIQRL